jgi:hypothetical protein
MGVQCRHEICLTSRPLCQSSFSTRHFQEHTLPESFYAADVVPNAGFDDNTVDPIAPANASDGNSNENSDSFLQHNSTDDDEVLRPTLADETVAAAVDPHALPKITHGMIIDQAGRLAHAGMTNQTRARATHLE